MICFPHRVIVIRKDPESANLDPYGNRPTIAEVTIRCKIEESSKLVKNQQGEEVVSTTQFLFPGRIGIAYYDEVKWTDAAGTELQRSPIAVELFRDGIGAPMLLMVSV